MQYLHIFLFPTYTLENQKGYALIKKSLKKNYKNILSEGTI